MYLEAVVVCVNYGDFLAHTLPQNKNAFDNMVVVTTPTDLYTQAVCEFNNVKCITTDSFYENGASFNKANGINVGLKALKRKDWVVHLDADIWLPTLFRRVLDACELNDSCIYGIDRLMCKSYDDYQRFMSYQKPMHEGWVYMHLDFFPMGTRLVKYHDDGYIPIGYFQLFNANKCQNWYPTEHMTAARTDMQFAMKWPKRKRRMIPELACVHLESEGAIMGSNWSGRKTPIFGTVNPHWVLGTEQATPKKRSAFWKHANLTKY